MGKQYKQQVVKMISIVTWPSQFSDSLNVRNLVKMKDLPKSFRRFYQPNSFHPKRVAFSESAWAL